MFQLSDIVANSTSLFLSFPRAKSGINNTERPRSLAHPSHPALRQLLFRLDTQLQLYDRLLLTLIHPNLNSRKVHTNTRKVPDIPVERRIDGAGIISKFRSGSLSSSSESLPTTKASFQGIDAVENDTSKPLYVRSAEVGTLKMRCTDSKKNDTS